MLRATEIVSSCCTSSAEHVDDAALTLR